MTKPKLNIVSNIQIREENGGMSGLNKHIYKELSLKFLFIKALCIQNLASKLRLSL